LITAPPPVTGCREHGESSEAAALVTVVAEESIVPRPRKRQRPERREMVRPDWQWLLRHRFVDHSANGSAREEAQQEIRMSEATLRKSEVFLRRL
jgi:hypothetical protein